MKVLGIIPARGGSKGVPRKNIKSLCGKPLISYTIDAALGSNRLTRTILSTEDAGIAAVGRSLGVEVPFMRPAELAEDMSPSLHVVTHALAALEADGHQYDAVCLLQPTNPLRRAEDIDAAIDLFESSGADSVVSVLPVPHQYNPRWVYWQNSEGRLTLCTGETNPVARRQDLPLAYHRDGSVYVTRRNVLDDYKDLYGKNVLGYEMEPERSINIDTIDDWEKAEIYFRSASMDKRKQDACHA